MPRKFDPRRFPDVKPWIVSAVNEERRYEEVPLWADAPPAEFAFQERLSRIRFLRKCGKTEPRAITAADRLETCASDRRCLSGACPECTRLFQRWCVRRSRKFISKHLSMSNGELIAVSIVPPQPVIRHGQLARFSITNLQRRLKHRFSSASIDIALGGIDFSFNEDRDGKYKSFWSPHAYVIAVTQNRKDLAQALKGGLIATKPIPRPVKIVPFNNTASRRSYAWKIHFKRRIGYDDIKQRKDGEVRKCRNTSTDKLRAAERLELFLFLNDIGLAARIFLLGAKPLIASTNVKIRRTASLPLVSSYSKIDK
jgi:hypothetical protein